MRVRVCVVLVWVCSLTVHHVQRDGVRLGVGGRAGELAGVRQLGPLDQQGAHQVATALLRHLGML